MKLTRRKALEICRDLWAWLAETGGDCKRKWPGWVQYGDITNHCPCCHYAAGRFDSFGVSVEECRRCPIREFWSENRFTSWRPAPCERSVFGRWSDAQNKRTRRKHAAAIRDAAIAELAKMKPLKKKAARRRTA